jgi:hypothetical protein
VRLARAGGVAVVAVLAAMAACGARAPEPVDVLALTRELGSDGARRALVARVLADPRDVQARLALARLADELGRPGEAVEQLEAVVALGGPLGTRWRADDRARLARLLLARGELRLARGAASALSDLERAASFGAAVPAAELARAHVAHGLARLRHVDLHEREAGRRELADRDLTRDRAVVDPEVVGARDRATPGDRGSYGAWLWARGARRAAYEELAAWVEATPADARDPALSEAYLRAVTWWTPVDGPAVPPAVVAAGGAARCRWPAASATCAPAAVLGTPAEPELAVALPGAREHAPDAALAWAAIEVAAARRGEVALGPALRARVDAEVAADPAAAPALRWVVAYTAGAAAPPPPGSGTGEPAAARLADARTLVTGGGTDAAPLPRGADARTLAAARYATARIAALASPADTVAGAPTERTLLAIAYAYHRDADVGERLARDAIAASVDEALATATTAALFDALSDPGRARAAWQAAVDASPEPAFVEGLAEAEARGNDPDAALINATVAAAASGDPGAVWARVARVLADAGKSTHALTAARSAIDLAGPDALAAALDAAVDASRALARPEQVASLAARRAALWPPAGGDVAGDPTDPVAAVAALGEGAGSVDPAALDRAWLASRWAPRDVATRAALLRLLPAGDARARVVEAELVGLATDRDPLLALAAVAAVHVPSGR